MYETKSSPESARWFTYELRSGSDLHDALFWLEQAYRGGGQGKEIKVVLDGL